MARDTQISILVNGSLPPPLGGVATYCQDYLRSSLSCEFNITLCRAILIKSVFTTKGLLRFTLRVLNSIVITFVWIAMLLIKRPDIVHVHTNSYTGFYVKGVLTVLARMFGAKTVLHIHGAEFKEFYWGTSWFMRWLIRFLIRTNCAVIVLSKEWRGFFESIGIPDELIVVMTNTVFLPDISEGKEVSEKRTVLFMSCFEERKGIHELVNAIERRGDSLGSCRFVLAGPRTHDWEAVADRIASLNLSDMVEMPGPLVDEGKDLAYREADIYVLQSYAEGMPIGLLEAMSYGLACITTGVGGIPDIVQDKQNGLLIEPGDTNALSEAMELLVRDVDLRKRLGDEARATIEQRYNWAERAKDISRLYYRLVGTSYQK